MRHPAAALRLGITAAMLCGAAAPAAAQSGRILISDVSDRTIAIGSNFAGTDILVFGAIAADQGKLAHIAPNQIVIVLRGENRTLTARRKARVAGIWVNRDAVTFTRVPSLYAVATTGPLDALASEWLMQREELGLANLPLPIELGSGAGLDDASEFRAALVRQRMETGLYRESEGAVTLIDGALFRARLWIPSNVQTGRYRVDVYLLRDGDVVARDAVPLRIDRAGLERRVARMAERRPLLYGVIAVLWALGAGWVGTILLRGR